MHADEHVLAVADVAAHQRDVRFAVELIVEGEDAEGAVLGGQRGRGHALHQPLGLHPVLNEVGDRDHQQAVLPRELRQLRHARHRAVLVHDFADDAGRIEAGHARQIDGGFGLPRAHEHAAVARAQREHVPGSREIGRRAFGVDGRQHGRRRGRRPRCRC